MFVFNSPSPCAMFSWQDKEQERLQNAAVEEESSSSDSDSGSSSESSQVGLQKSKAKPKARQRKPKASDGAEDQPRKKQGGVSKGGDVQADSLPTPAPATSTLSTPALSEKSDKSAVASSSEKGMTTAVLLDKTALSLKSLQATTPWSIWAQSVKPREVEARISKGLELVSKISSKPAEPMLTEAAAQISAEVDRVNRQNEVLQALATASDIQQTLVTEVKQIKEMILASPDQEQCSSFLTDLARKLVEVNFSSSGSVSTLFDFLSLQPNPFYEGFSLSLCTSLLGSSSGSGDFTVTLMQIQQNALNSWMDRFRTTAAQVEGILQSLPESWCIPHIARPGQCKITTSLSRLAKCCTHDFSGLPFELFMYMIDRNSESPEGVPSPQPSKPSEFSCQSQSQSHCH